MPPLPLCTHAVCLRSHRYPAGFTAKAGLPPGTLIHVGKVMREKPHITIIDYTSADLEEKAVTSVGDILERDLRGVKKPANLTGNLYATGVLQYHDDETITLSNDIWSTSLTAQRGS